MQQIKKNGPITSIKNAVISSEEEIPLEGKQEIKLDTMAPLIEKEDSPQEKIQFEKKAPENKQEEYLDPSINSLLTEKFSFTLQKDERKSTTMQLDILKLCCYLEDFDSLSFLFSEIKKQQLQEKITFEDSNGKHILEIAIEKQNLSLVTLIGDYFINNPPEYGKFGSFNVKTVLALVKMGYEKLGDLIDSRLFLIHPKIIKQMENFEKSFLIKKGDLTTQKFQDNLPQILEAKRMNKKNTKRDRCMVNFFRKIRQYWAYFNFLYSNKMENPNDKYHYAYSHYIVDIPNLLSYCTCHMQNNKTVGFFHFLLKKYRLNEDIQSIYGSKVLRSICYFLWYRYGRIIFIYTLLENAAVLGFVLFSSTMYIRVVEGTEKNMNYVSIGFGLYILLRVFLKELCEIISNCRKCEYFRSEKNYYDLIMLIFFGNYIAMLSLVIFKEDFMDNKASFFQGFLFVRSILVVILAFRFIYLFQIYEQFGFYFRLVLESVRQLFFFFMVFFLMIVGFSFAVNTLFFEPKYNSWEESEKQWIIIFDAVFRIALSDFSNYTNDVLGFYNDEYYISRKIILKIYFYLASLILSLTLLNILIAILNDSFTKIKEKYETYITYSMTRVLHDINMNYKIVKKKEHKSIGLKIMSFFMFVIQVIFGVWSRHFVEGIENEGHDFVISEIVKSGDSRARFNNQMFYGEENKAILK